MYGKMIIRCCLVVRTGLHIGAGNAFSAIGAVDSQVVRDPLTGLPMIPGSSLKGKLRSLLARSLSKDIQRMPDFDQDDGRIKRLFGSADPVHRARLHHFRRRRLLCRGHGVCAGRRLHLPRRLSRAGDGDHRHR